MVNRGAHEVDSPSTDLTGGKHLDYLQVVCVCLVDIDYVYMLYNSREYLRAGGGRRIVACGGISYLRDFLPCV